MSKDDNIIPITRKSNKKLSFRFVSPTKATENEAPKIETLIHSWKEGTIAVWAGEGGIGKSTLLLAVASAIASLFQVHDIYNLATSTKPKRVMFLSGEDDTETVQSRMHYFFNKNGLDPSLVESNLCVTCDVDLFGKLSDETWLWELKNTIDEEEIDVLVIDTWSVFSGVDNENDNAECGNILTAMKKILIGNQKEGARKLSIMIVAHTNSEGGVRGASALRYNARAVYVMRKMNDKEEAKVRSDNISGNYIALDIIKANYGPSGNLRWFKQVEFGQFELADQKFMDAIGAKNVPSSSGLTSNKKANAKANVTTITTETSPEEDDGPCDGLASINVSVSKRGRGLFGVKNADREIV